MTTTSKFAIKLRYDPEYLFPVDVPDDTMIRTIIGL